MLRTVQIGLKVEDLDYLEYGELFDMFIESGNDNCDYKQKATQTDFDKF